MGLIFPKVSDQSREIDLGLSSPHFGNNKVDTAKYNLITFLPKSLILQFTRISNIIFLINAVLQGIPIISSLSPISAISPLAFVLFVSMLRQGFEDYKRHKSDSLVNSRLTRVLRGGIFIEINWEQLQVGDFVKICNKQIIPADILLLHSSEENSICFVQTSNLDGQSNLKEKHAFTQGIRIYPNQFQSLSGQCLVDPPKANLYEFDGQIRINGSVHYLSYQNLLLRQTVLKNTNEAIGVALYCGYDSKIMKNQGQLHHKVSKVQQKLNYIQIGLMALLLLMCAVCSIGYYFIHNKSNLRLDQSYIPLTNLTLSLQSGLMFLTIFLLLNFLIPITLNILIQGLKTFSGLFLSFDRKLYDSEHKKYCGVLNSTIVEELGLVDCVLTDKTGTLTANQMKFKAITIQNQVYTSQYIQENIQELKCSDSFNDFWLSLIICHDVVKDFQKDQYQGSSPDEVCFINFAHSIGYIFVKRTKKSIELIVHDQKRIYELMDIIAFSSRKRMSVIVKDTLQNHRVIVFTKGADSSVFDKACWYNNSQEFSNHLNHFAKEGLRTLVFAKRFLSIQRYKTILKKKQQIKSHFRRRIISKQEASVLENELIQQIESCLQIVGASGIQDRLQQEVPQTISRLQRAGIRVMMITGDKLQTAQNIGYLAHMIKQNYSIFKLSNETQNIRTKSESILFQIQANHENVALIIEGKQINAIMQEEDINYIKIYTQLFYKSKTVIFCRSSPKQKALIVKFIKEHMNFVVLAIGDGGNDVGMIQQAHIGVGIIGKQGNAASIMSDFSFGKFKFLDRLILHHGRWFYYRLSYFFVYFGLKNMIITWCIFFFAIDSAFSGVFNYTQLFYLVYNCFIAISPLVYFGLYGQDINDDLEPKIKQYLPQIYKQTKSEQLFSYKRYIIWSIIGVATAFALYYITKNVINPINTVDSEGHIADLSSSFILNGISLTIVLLLISYLDTETHNSFFNVFVLGMCTISPTVAYFICQNQMKMLDYYHIYTDNFNLRFWLTVFLFISVTFLIKIGMACFHIQFSPTLIDYYKIAKHKNKLHKIDRIMKKAIVKLAEKDRKKKEESKNNNKKTIITESHITGKISSTEETIMDLASNNSPNKQISQAMQESIN